MISVAYDARALHPAARHWGVGAFLDGVLDRLGGRFRFIGLAPSFPGPADRDVRMWPNIRRTHRAIFELSAWFAAHDVYWGTSHYLPHTVTHPAVVTVHDMLLINGIEGPTPLARARMVSSIRRARVIAAVSSRTADEIGARFPELKPKISVIRHGFTRSGLASSGSWAAQPAGGAGCYVVMLGCHRPRKNPRFALEAVARARGAGLDISLVVTGDIFPGFRALFAAAPAWVRCVGVLPRREVEALLAGAVALVFPTVYEGFGFPILEAMAAGCPVLGLDIPVNREIGGGAALLSSDPGQWVRWMRDLLGRSSLRAELQQRGSENLARFSWDRAAAGYCEIFQRLAR